MADLSLRELARGRGNPFLPGLCPGFTRGGRTDSHTGDTVTGADELAHFSCLMFRGGRDDTVGGGGKQDARDLLRLMADPLFDPIRERQEFAEAARKVGEILNED